MKLIQQQYNNMMLPNLMIGLNCIETCLVNILKSFDKKYELTFCELFNFKYNSGETGLLGKRIIIEHTNVEYYCYKFFGIFIAKETDEKLQPVSTVIKTNTQKCIWLGSDRRINAPHFFILIKKGLNQNICIDPTYITQYIILTNSEIEDLLEDSYNVYFHEEKPFHMILKSSIDLFKKHIYYFDIAEQYTELINQLSQYESLEEEFYDTVPYLQSFEYIICYLLPGNRELFLLYLKTINQYCALNNYNELTILLKDTIKIWKHLKMIILKVKYSNNYLSYKNTIINKFCDIKKIESRILDLLQRENNLLNHF